MNTRTLKRNKYAVFIKYAVVGSLGTAVDAGSLYVFVELMHIHLLLSTAASFVLAVLNNFTLNKYWTFENKSSNVRKQFIKFLIVATTGLVLTEFCMALFVYGLGIWYIFSKLFTSGLVLVWNFLANKYWTFKDRIFHRPGGKKYEYQLSIIVPAYNEAGRIGKTLEEIDLYFSDKPMSRQIIVVDDGSDDETSAVVDRMREKIKDLALMFVQPDENKSFWI